MAGEQFTDTGHRGEGLEEQVDLRACPWYYEAGEDVEDTGERNPYRTIFAEVRGALDDREPVADLDPDVVDAEDVGRLIAAAPELLRVLRWVATRSGDGEAAGDPAHLRDILREIQGEADRAVKEATRG